MALKVLDAGSSLMLTGDTREEVDAALTGYVARGSKVVTQAVAVGNRWTAACTLPASEAEGDSSDDMQLSDYQAKARAGGSDPEVDDGCTVEELGFKRIVYGPSKRHVLLRVEHMKRFGAELVGEIEQDGARWVAIVDTGGADKSFRW